MNRVKRLVSANEVYKQGYSGKNVRIALLDTGVYAGHPDLRTRVAGFMDFVNHRHTPYDDNGHGTHIAGILCGSGMMSGYRISGMAPRAELIVMKVLDQKGNGQTSDVLSAVRWILQNHRQYNIRLMNFSVGFLPRAGKKEQEELLNAVERLWDEDVMVVTAAGNNGPGQETVTVPGISRKVVTVGACDDTASTYDDSVESYESRAENATGTGSVRIRDDRVGEKWDLQYGYSGKGPTGCCIIKPEILAPGTRILSLSNHSDGYARKSGTSMAAPVVCGALALAFEKRKSITPAELKLKLYETVEPPAPESNVRAWGTLQVDNLLKVL